MSNHKNQSGRASNFPSNQTSRTGGVTHCACPTEDGTSHFYVNCANSTMASGAPYTSCVQCCVSRQRRGDFDNFAGGTGFRKDRIGGTGQRARFANQSGNGKGKILGLTTQQALIAIGVGVAAYFIIKKVK